MGKKYLGKDAVILVGVAGATPITVLGNIKDPNLDMSRDKTDVTCLSDGDYKSEVVTYKNMTFGFSLRVEAGDTNYTTLWTAYQAGTPLAFVIDNGRGTQVIDADFSIDSWGEPKTLADGQFVAVSCSQLVDTRAPNVDSTNSVVVPDPA